MSAIHGKKKKKGAQRSMPSSYFESATPSSYFESATPSSYLESPTPSCSATAVPEFEAMIIPSEPCVSSSKTTGFQPEPEREISCSSPEIPPIQHGIADMNEDILRLIFENFDLQPGLPTTARTRKDLFSAARTCKAFVEPALNSLWHILPSLLPLFLLLPSAEVSKNHYFCDRLPLSNWERFDIHALRVRMLYMERPCVIISPHVYLRIRSMRQRDAPLLPGLKGIYIPDNASLDLSPALLLASESSLNFVQLNNSATSDRQFYIPFLFLLSVNSPNLTHLALCGTTDTSSSLELVPCFKNLRSLEFRLSGTYLDSQLLRDLGKLDNLLDLTLDTSSSIQAPMPVKPSDLTPPSTNSTFIRLRKLHILGTPSSMSRILNEMNVLTNLTSLKIRETTDSSGHDTESSWNRCFRIISTFPAIEDIEISQSEDAGWGINSESLSTSCFYPLYKLNNVTSFVINNSTLSGSDDDFRFLACAFPKLKKFVEPGAEYREGRTLACLLHFSQANQDLRELKISLASNIFDNLRAINALGRSIIQNYQHPLEKLHIASNFGSLDLPDMIQVAQFLDLIFPNLSTLEAYYHHSDACEVSTWTKIQQIRLALQAARIKASSASKISDEYV